MIKIILIAVAHFSSLSFADEASAILCYGSHWEYKFMIESNKCEHLQKATKDIPGFYKKGHVKVFQNEDALTPQECWQSIARIQMDGAKCSPYPK